MKRALITGITGQDGAYLQNYYLKKVIEVMASNADLHHLTRARIDHLYQHPRKENSVERRFILHYGDVTDSTNIIRIIQEVQPDEIYNLAAQSHVAVSFETPEYTAQSDALGRCDFRSDTNFRLTIK